ILLTVIDDIPHYPTELAKSISHSMLHCYVDDVEKPASRALFVEERSRFEVEEGVSLFDILNVELVLRLYIIPPPACVVHTKRTTARVLYSPQVSHRSPKIVTSAMGLHVDEHSNYNVLSRIATSDGHGENSSYFDGWKAYDNDPFHPIDNPKGVIQMGLAENQVNAVSQLVRYLR
ncbi:hypothetical protein GW17_00036900, partial [Ensete ventricosum]